MIHKSISFFIDKDIEYFASVEFYEYVNSIANAAFGESPNRQNHIDAISENIQWAKNLYNVCFPLNDVGFKFLMEYLNTSRINSEIIIDVFNVQLFSEDLYCATVGQVDNKLRILVTHRQCNALQTLDVCISNGWLDTIPIFTELEEQLAALPEEERNKTIDTLDLLGIRQREDSSATPINTTDFEEVDANNLRFSSAMWFEEVQNKDILIAGIGGIGSWTALQLSRLNPRNIILYDDDRVEDVNLAGQFYHTNQIGHYKVDAVANSITEYSNYYQVMAFPTLFDNTCESCDVMICGFDNMSARKTFVKAWYNHVKGKSEEDKAKCLFIDGRLSVDDIQVFCIRGDDEYHLEQYLSKYLFDDSEATATHCSYKQTTYTACMIGSIITNLFINFVTNTIDDNLRELPFLTTYDSTIMKFKIQD